MVEMNKFQQPMRFGGLFGGLSVKPRGLDSWRRPEGSRPLGTRLLFSFFPTCKRLLSFRTRSTSFFLSKRMRTCLSSFRIAGSIGSDLEKTCKRSLPVPRFSEDRALFIRSITKLARVNGQFLSQPFQVLSELS